MIRRGMTITWSLARLLYILLIPIAGDPRAARGGRRKGGVVPHHKHRQRRAQLVPRSQAWQLPDSSRQCCELDSHRLVATVQEPPYLLEYIILGIHRLMYLPSMQDT